jgi:primary-amine oxidase
VEGLVATIDLAERRVLAVLDDGSAPPPMDTTQSFTFRGATQQSISGVGLPTYQIEAHRVSWEGWQFEFGMDPREGLVLYRVAHRDDAGTMRSILARASLAEMLVPYGDTAPAWRFRSVFDVAEFGLGTTATTLIPGADLPPGATVLSAVLADESAHPRQLDDVIGLYERDGGLRWRHAGRAVRSRELVLRSVATIGNYDYGVSWVFSPDGVLAVELDLTGVMQVKGIHAPDPESGAQVGRHLSAVHHQHFFSFRLDFDIDGRTNRIVEAEVVPLPAGAGNPAGTGFSWKSRVLASELEAIRDGAPSASRHWIIESVPLGAATGRPRGYALVPGALPDLLAGEGSPLRERGAFAAHALWVTRFAAGERYPAGPSPGQEPGPTGLPVYSADDASLVGTDLVVWYTAGLTHIPRPEEWPLMPVSRLRFELRPSDFLTNRVWH